MQTELKYEGYIKKQQTQLKQYRKMHLQTIPNNLDYSLIGGLSTEVREKLIQYRPENLSQMLKISGITPAAATILMIYLKNQEKQLKMKISLLDSATFGDFLSQKNHLSLVNGKHTK